jgi:2-oxo-hept-3-ene-1,7-dioate hydratase
MSVAAAALAGPTAAAIGRGMTAQLAEWRRAVAAHGHRLGWKIGFGDRAAQQRAGLVAPVMGFLRRDRRLVPGGVYALPAGAVVKAEVEVALRLGRDVGSGASLDAAEAAIAASAAAIELVDLTHPLEGIEAQLRGNLYHAAVAIGPEQPGVPAAPRATLTARLRDREQVVRVSEPPRLPERFGELVLLVADTLAAHGERLAAGDWIICGSVVEPLVVAPGMRLEVEMAPFERLMLSFAAA